MNKVLIVSLNSGLPLFARSFSAKSSNDSNMDDLQLSSLLFALNKISSVFEASAEHVKDDLRQFEQGCEIITTISSKLGEEVILLAISSLKYLVDSNFSKFICINFAKACEKITLNDNSKKYSFQCILDEVFRTVLMSKLDQLKLVNEKYEVLFSFPNIGERGIARHARKPNQMDEIPVSKGCAPNNTVSSSGSSSNRGKHDIRDTQMKPQAVEKTESNKDTESGLFSFCTCFRTNRVAHDMMEQQSSNHSSESFHPPKPSPTSMETTNHSSSISGARSSNTRTGNRIIPHSNNHSIVQLSELYDEMQALKSINWREAIKTPYFLHLDQDEHGKLDLLGDEVQDMIPDDSQKRNDHQELKVISLEDEVPQSNPKLLVMSHENSSRRAAAYSVYRNPQTTLVIQPGMSDDASISMKVKPILFHLAVWIKFGISENLV